MIEKNIENKFNRIYIILFSLIAIIPLYPKMNMINIVLISFSLGLLGYSIYSKRKLNFKILILYLIPFFLILFLDILSLFQSEIVSTSLKVTKKNFKYFFLVLVVFLAPPKYSKKYLFEVFKKCFVISCILLTIGIFIYSIFLDVEYNYKSLVIFRRNFENQFDFHGTYLSLYIGASILFLIDHIMRNLSLKRVMNIIMVFWLLLFQYFIGADSPFYATILACVLLIVYYLTNKKVLLGILLIIGLSLVLNSFSIYKDLRAYNNNMDEKFESNIFSKFDHRRIGIYNCAINIFEESTITEKFLGIGTGDLQEVLNDCYEGYSKDKHNLFKDGKKYNTHNQYLDIIVGRGVVGGIIFLIIILYNFYMISKCEEKEDFYFYLSLNLLFFISFFTENIISRQHGVILYSIINILFLSKSLEKYEKSIST